VFRGPFGSTLFGSHSRKMLTFLLSAFAISLSAVMAPGPMTAAAFAIGTRSRHAGALIALGHAVVEMPLIVLLAAGVGNFLTAPGIKLGIELAGGTVLVVMAAQLLLALRRETVDSQAPAQRHPLLIGIMLTAANPYFVIWWATVGLALATQAIEWGALALLAFAVIHWMSDLIWLEVLSWAGFKGSQALGPRSEKIIALVCATVLLGFGLKFFYEASSVYPESEPRQGSQVRCSVVE
jgi:threonine/homoserine/homoserine lactone efflux protein